jgi:hypothetical protein
MGVKGELMRAEAACEKGGISMSTFHSIVQLGYIQKYNIGGRTFVHYRDFLRGCYEFECKKKGKGGRPRKDVTVRPRVEKKIDTVS